MTTLGERIKEIRLSNKLTQSEFAKKLHISRAFVSKIESNKEHPSDTILAFIAVLFDYRYEWIKNEEGDKRTQGYQQNIIKNTILDSQKVMGLIKTDDYNVKYYFVNSMCRLINMFNNIEIKQFSSRYYARQVSDIMILITSWIPTSKFIIENNSIIYDGFDDHDKEYSAMEKSTLHKIKVCFRNAIKATQIENLDDYLDEYDSAIGVSLDIDNE